jgi:hypothetical protein
MPKTHEFWNRFPLVAFLRMMGRREGLPAA